MSLLDYILIGVLSVWFIISILFFRKSKKQNKCPGCSGRCSSCPKNVNNDDKKTY